MNVENSSIEIAPLLFIIFVENAFKHGIEPAANDGYIHIDIHQKGEMIEFSCENSVEEKGSKDGVGIGLENLKRRLELIYPNHHNVEINAKEKSYTAKLRIEI